MTATITDISHFRSERTPAQKSREREQKLTEDVKCALPGIPPIVIAKAQNMAVSMLNREGYKEAHRIATNWARDPKNHPPQDPPPSAA